MRRSDKNDGIGWLVPSEMPFALHFDSWWLCNGRCRVRRADMERPRLLTERGLDDTKPDYSPIT